MQNSTMDNEIVVRTSKMELTGEVTVASSYRFTLAILGADVESKIKAGKTTVDQEIAKMQNDPVLADRLAADFSNQILTSDDPAFRNQVIMLLESVFGQIPDEHFVEEEGDSDRIKNRKRNNQINAIMAIMSYMKDSGRTQPNDNVDDGADFPDSVSQDSTADDEFIYETAVIVGEEPSEVIEPIAYGIPEDIAKMGMVDLATLSPELREQVLNAVATASKLK